jgi:hypothetical protein
MKRSHQMYLLTIILWGHNFVAWLASLQMIQEVVLCLAISNF